MKQIVKYQGNQVDLCQGSTCVKTKGPAADFIAGLVLLTTLVACVVFIAKLVK